MKRVLLLIACVVMAFTSLGQTDDFINEVAAADSVTAPTVKVRKKAKKTIKRKVAIGRFSNETQYGKGIFYDKENDPMGKQGLDILSAKLQQCGKFILLERNDLDIVLNESGSEMQKIGADYIVLGSITQYGRKNETHKGFFRVSKTQTVETGVNIRVVEAASGMIVYSQEAKGVAETTTKEVIGMGGKIGYDATLSDKAIAAAISQLVENIINECEDNPWKSFILGIDENDNYIISGGVSQGLETGDVFSVYSRGKIMKNPQTGMDVELPGSKIGEMTVTVPIEDSYPENEVSLCTYKGQMINKENLEKYYIIND